MELCSCCNCVRRRFLCVRARRTKERLETSSRLKGNSQQEKKERKKCWQDFYVKKVLKSSEIKETTFKKVHSLDRFNCLFFFLYKKTGIEAQTRVAFFYFYPVNPDKEQRPDPVKKELLSWSKRCTEKRRTLNMILFLDWVVNPNATPLFRACRREKERERI